MPDDNIRAATLMVLGTGAFTVNDMFIKLAGQDLPMFQIIAMRGLAVTLFLAVLTWWQRAGLAGMTRRDKALVGLRSVAECGAAYFFLSALLNMPIANVTAILQVLPLSVALAAFLFLREPLGWRRMSAILIGFAGVIVIVRPGTDGFTIWSVYALVAVALVTVRDLTTRMLTRSVPSGVVALSASVGVTMLGLMGGLSEVWNVPTMHGALWVSGAVISVIGGYLFVIMAMRTGELSYVAPFRYFALLFALVIGWMVFGEWPDMLTFLGSAVVVATGVYALYRERVLRRQAAA